MEQYSGQGGAKSTTRTFSFRLGGGLLLEKRSPKPYFTGLRTGLLCSFKFYRTAIIRNSSLSLIKRQSKFILLKLRNTTSPNDRFGFISHTDSTRLNKKHSSNSWLKFSHKLPQITTNNPPTENTNLIHSNPIYTNFNYKGIWVKECR